MEKKVYEKVTLSYEEVMEGLCACSSGARCHRCPYKTREKCTSDLMVDAVALLTTFKERCNSYCQEYAEALAMIDREGQKVLDTYVEALKTHFPHSYSVLKAIDVERDVLVKALYGEPEPVLDNES